MRSFVGSRRHVLQALGAGILGAPVLESSGRAEDQPDLIDAHIHVWTADVAKYPLKPGATVADLVPASFTPEQFLAHAKPVGVGRAVLIQMSFYGADNSYMLDCIAANSESFRGIAVVDPNVDAPNAMRLLKAKGVRGFRIYPNTPLDEPGMNAMYRCAAKERLAICHLCNSNELPTIDAMCARHPETTVVIDHFGRIGIDGKIRDDDVVNLCALAKRPRTHVKVSAFYALGQKRSPYKDLMPMIRRLVDTFGPERLMWASDSPYQVENGHRYADSVALIRDHADWLSPSDRDWILRRTSEGLFFG